MSTTKRRAVEECDKSGLSAADFASQRGIRAVTLNVGGAQFEAFARSATGAIESATTELVELPTSTIATEASDGILVEIELRNGRRVTALGRGIDHAGDL